MTHKLIITVWLHGTMNRRAGTGQMMVPGTPRDSPYVLDTLLNLDAEPLPQVVTTDNGSCNDIMFIVLGILNYRFAPRFADLSDQRRGTGAPPIPFTERQREISPAQANGDYGTLE